MRRIVKGLRETKQGFIERVNITMMDDFASEFMKTEDDKITISYLIFQYDLDNLDDVDYLFDWETKEKIDDYYYQVDVTVNRDNWKAWDKAREKENVIEVLQKIQNDYIIYDGYYPQCTEEWYVLDEAIKELKKETVPREVYEHEYTLRKNLETEILHLKRIINNLWTPVDEALPKRDERTQNLSEDVQVTIKDEFGFTVDVAYYDYQEKKWQSEMLDDCAKVLAWKPLPQPYRNDLCDTNPFNNKFGS